MSIVNKYLCDFKQTEEGKKFLAMSTWIRRKTWLSETDRLKCEVCDASIDDETISNHHIIKVEYLAFLAYRYNLLERVKSNKKNRKKQKNVKKASNSKQQREKLRYEFREDRPVFSPRVAVCERHHTMMHELLGDVTNTHELDTITSEEIDGITKVFQKNDDLLVDYITTKTKYPREYQKMLVKMWNGVMVKSLFTLEDQAMRIALNDKDNQFYENEEYAISESEEIFDEVPNISDQFDEIKEQDEVEDKVEIEIENENDVDVEKLDRNFKSNKKSNANKKANNRTKHKTKNKSIYKHKRMNTEHIDAEQSDKEQNLREKNEDDLYNREYIEVIEELVEDFAEGKDLTDEELEIISEMSYDDLQVMLLDLMNFDIDNVFEKE